MEDRKIVNGLFPESFQIIYQCSIHHGLLLFEPIFFILTRGLNYIQKGYLDQEFKYLIFQVFYLIFFLLCGKFLSFSILLSTMKLRV